MASLVLVPIYTEAAMDVIASKIEELSDAVFSSLANYRHQAVEQALGWELEAKMGEPLDAFDGPDTLYVVARDSAGHVNGCARLLPTDRPYLLGELFPELLGGVALPRSAQVWELSRFSACDFNSQTSAALSQHASDVALKLLHGALACAAAHGATRLITLAPISLERLLRRAGLRAHRAAPPAIIDGHPLVACWIEIDPAQQ